MRPLVVTSLALLVAATAAAAAAAAAADTQPATADKAKQYIDAMKELSELLGKGFETIKDLTNGLPGLLGTVSKVIGIINTLFGLPSSQGKQLQAYFQEVNSNFQRVFIQMDEVKRLISWESTRGKYAADEKDIIALQLYYERYLSNPDDTVNRDQFVREYDRRQGAATNLYLGVVSEGQVLLDNLAEAAMTYTKNHRRLTTDFLMGLFKLILQGSMMDVLYYRLKQAEEPGSWDAARRETQWDEKLNTLMRKIDSTDVRLVEIWRDQANKDIDDVMRVHGGKGQRDLAHTMYNALKSKFYWRRWCVISTKSANGDNYHLNRNGYHWQRNSHNKRVEIMASDKKTLNMDAVKGAINHVSKQAYSVNVVPNMNSYFSRGMSDRGQRSYDYNYVIRALCADCRLDAAGDPGQHYSQHFVSFWYIVIPVALDGNIAAC